MSTQALSTQQGLKQNQQSNQAVYIEIYFTLGFNSEMFRKPQTNVNSNVRLSEGGFLSSCSLGGFSLVFEFEIEHMARKPWQCKTKLSLVESHRDSIVLFSLPVYYLYVFIDKAN